MKKIHFIGIGGIGISALARFLKEKGYEISGSDLKASKITAELEKEGVAISIPHGEQNVIGKDLVIYSAAIKAQNAEFKKAKALGIKTLSRKEALPLILRDKQVFAVAGAHGKSTTSSILASLMNDASVIIGAILKEFGSNMIYKESDKLIFEADESDSSFLNANPYVAIVTNAEAEHLEHYKNDLNKLHKAYEQFLNSAKIRIINGEDEFLKTLNLRKGGIEVVSCPTCGRTQIDLIGLANKVETMVQQFDLDIKVAVMGCVVNGPGEAKEADLGIAGGKGVGLLIKKGEIVRKVPEAELLDTLREELEHWAK